MLDIEKISITPSKSQNVHPPEEVPLEEATLSSGAVLLKEDWKSAVEQNQVSKVWFHGGLNSGNFELGLFLLEGEANDGAPGKNGFRLLRGDSVK